MRTGSGVWTLEQIELQPEGQPWMLKALGEAQQSLGFKKKAPKFLFRYLPAASSASTPLAPSPGLEALPRSKTPGWWK